jgi:alkylation response protein AidB-like acyl-CoA dehydrogenase
VLSDRFTEEQEALRAMVREFARAEVEPLIDEAERTQTFPRHLLPRLGELGLLGIIFPERYGGAGADKVTECVFIEEMSKVCAGITTGVNVHVDLGTFPILEFGTPEQRERYLPRAIRGEIVGSYAITEPLAGSDVAGLATTAERRDGGYLINGRKIFIGNGTFCDYCLVAAYTDTDRRGAGISVFIVERDAAGFRLVRKLDKMGHRSSETAELAFEDCWVPDSALLGGQEGALKALMGALVGGRVSHGVKSAAIAEAAYEAAVAYAGGRNAFGRPIGKLQAIRFKLATMATRVAAAKALAYKAAWLYSVGRSCTREASMAKFFSAEVAEYVCREAVQIHGGYGYVREYAVERLFRDARLTSISEGTSEVQQLIIARELGL